MRVPSLRELRAKISHSADVGRLIANKEYILLTNHGVYVHADWRGMNAEVQIKSVEVMKGYLDDVLVQLNEEDPIVTETRKRVQIATTSMKAGVKTAVQKAKRKVNVRNVRRSAKS